MRGRVALGLLLLAACRDSAQAPTTELEPPPPGIKSEPKWLTFTCVEPGCDVLLTATVTVVGGRSIAIKRVVLSDREREDFEVTPSRTPPFILEAGDSFTIDVGYAPSGDPRLGDVDLRVTYTDASTLEEDGRVEPGELAIPFVRRLVGEPQLTVSPAELVFGPVLPSARRTLPLTISNSGFGNVGLVIDRIEADPPGEIRVENLPSAALVPGDTWDLQVVYAPLEEGYLEGYLKLVPVGSTLIPTLVPILGTSIARPTLRTEPSDGVDFGEVPVGMTETAVLLLKNRGAEDLHVRRFEVLGVPAGIELGAALPRMARTATVAPLDAAELTLTLASTEPGEVSTHVRVQTDDRNQPVVDVPVTALITKPIISIDPGAVDYGAVPRGWTIQRSIEVSNAGYGDLVVTGVSMLLGSSDLFTLMNVPNFPVRLRHGQRIGLEVEFRSEAEADFTGIVSVDSNDLDTPFVEVGLAARGASCDEGCPIANGTPSCTAGVCAVGSCDENFYDADRDASTGCECREVGRDPGQFCAEGIYLGSLGDEDNDRRSFTGILPTDTDVDVLRFFGNDQTSFFSEEYDVRVTLESTDPSIRFCVYRHNTGQHLSECFWENEECPANRSYRRDGRLGSDDSADYNVRVFRDPTAAPSCTPYTLFVRNG